DHAEASLGELRARRVDRDEDAGAAAAQRERDVALALGAARRRVDAEAADHLLDEAHRAGDVGVRDAGHALSSRSRCPPGEGRLSRRGPPPMLARPMLEEALETLVRRATEADGGADLAAARAAFHAATGEFAPGDPDYEPRIRCFLDWYLCAWTSADGTRPAE